MIKLRALKFAHEVITRCVMVTVVATAIPLLLHISLAKSIYTSLLIITVSVVTASLSSFYLGLDMHERIVITEKMKTVIKNRNE